VVVIVVVVVDNVNVINDGGKAKPSNDSLEW
jgi:hypothetical protein